MVVSTKRSECLGLALQLVRVHEQQNVHTADVSRPDYQETPTRDPRQSALREAYVIGELVIEIDIQSALDELSLDSCYAILSARRPPRPLTLTLRVP